MQSASRRGFASIFSASAISKPIFATSWHCLSRSSHVAPVTVKLLAVSRIHISPMYRAATAAAIAETPHESSQNGTGLITRFEELGTQGLISQTVVDTITQTMKLETMTPVQSQTINEAVQGADTLALARTGTGKTIAFLLPVIQRILQTSPELEQRQRKGKIDIQSIIISPTRELAEQIAQEARKLVGDTGIQVGLAVGGTGKSFSLQSMERFGCHILVGTPGRLNDILSDPRSRIKAPRLNSFVLDEADRLLDDGFGPAIEEIYTHLPSKLEMDRQTLMFSATMEQQVMGMVRKFMKKDFRTVQTIGKGEVQTHENVPQQAVVTHGLENQMPALLELIKRENATAENFKAIVFFNTSAAATLAFRIWEKSSLGNMTEIPGLVMHSRLSQSQRTRTSDRFRKSRKAVMFASDVAARGMDFPNVTHVIQMGMPKDRDTYIHRIGRTGRAGKEGQGWLFLSPWDKKEYIRKLSNLPIKEDKSIATAWVDMSQGLSIPQATADILTDAIQAAKSVDFGIKSDAFRSSLSVGQFFDKQTLVEALNRWSQYGWGMNPPPAVSYALAQKLGFARVGSMNIGNDSRAAPRKPVDTPNGSQNGGYGRRGFEDRDGGRRSFDKPSRGFGDRDSGRRAFDKPSRGFEDRDNGGRSFDKPSGTFGGGREGSTRRSFDKPVRGFGNHTEGRERATF